MLVFLVLFISISNSFEDRVDSYKIREGLVGARDIIKSAMSLK